VFNPGATRSFRFSHRNLDRTTAPPRNVMKPRRFIRSTLGRRVAEDARHVKAERFGILRLTTFRTWVGSLDRHIAGLTSLRIDSM